MDAFVRLPLVLKQVHLLSLTMVAGAIILLIAFNMYVVMRWVDSTGSGAVTIPAGALVVAIGLWFAYPFYRRLARKR